MSALALFAAAPGVMVDASSERGILSKIPGLVAKLRPRNWRL